MLGGIMCLFTAFVYAELMSRFPSNGSAFGFMYATFGELPAWIIGWFLLPRYGAVSAALVRAMSSYFVGIC
jgi:APA family basic amino acid/polyamine antiporter